MKGFNPKFYITGLEFALNHISLERSVYLFDLLLKHIPKLTGKILESSRKNFQGGEEKEKVSRAGKLLNENYWLYDGNGNLIEKPLTEISLDDLHCDYDKKHDNIDKLERELELKLDEIKRLEKETGGKFISSEELPEYEAWQKEQRRKAEEAKKSEWTPEIPAENVKPETVLFSPAPFGGKDLSGQGGQDGGGSDGEQAAINQETKNEGDSSHNAEKNKKIGKWGEECAQKYLGDLHSDADAEVIWLNENGKGEGYDFLVKENGQDAFYYEVKSKTGEKPTVFLVTGTQWAWATQLHAEGRGGMYRILVVSNAGTENVQITRIDDPVRRWKAGEIDADPVRIKL